MADSVPLLEQLRQHLLSLHLALLDAERSAYERQHGKINSNGQFLQLLIHDPHFAWLQPLTQWIVQIDEALETSTENEADASWLARTAEQLQDTSGASRIAEKLSSVLNNSVEATTQWQRLAQFLKDQIQK
jgi:hypothetical protein